MAESMSGNKSVSVDKTESMSGSKSVSSENRKTISPYDITSLDNPGFTITQVQLKGDNYEEWA